MQCALLLAEPQRAEMLGRALADMHHEMTDVALSPAMGGLIIGHEVARALKVRAFFTERENGVMALRRGFALKPGDKVVVVEDVITTGKSSKEVIELARSRGAEVLGVLAVVNRSPVPLDLDVPVKYLMKAALSAFSPDQCPQCREGKPLVKPGSRKSPC